MNVTKLLNLRNTAYILFGIGLLVPGFTVIVILGLHEAIAFTGFNCISAWNIIWFISGVVALFTPYIFTKTIIRSSNVKKLETQFKLFCLLEYISLQAIIGAYFTEADILCYGRDGQIGLEFVLTGWIAALTILASGFFYEWVYKKYHS